MLTQGEGGWGRLTSTKVRRVKSGRRHLCGWKMAGGLRGGALPF